MSNEKIEYIPLVPDAQAPHKELFKRAYELAINIEAGLSPVAVIPRLVKNR